MKSDKSSHKYSDEDFSNAIDLSVNLGKDMVLCNFVHKGFIARDDGMFFTAAFNDVVAPILVELEATKKLVNVLEQENEELLEKFFPHKIENDENVETKEKDGI